MVTIIFLIMSLFVVWLQYVREKNIVNLVSLLVMPYFVIVLFNNFFFYRLGFYKIEDNVLIMLLASLLTFFAGSCLVSPEKAPLIFEEDNTERFGKYNVNAMKKTLYIIGFIGLVKVTQLYLTGQFSAERFDEAEGLMGNGIVGHLLLVSYSILPIVFLYWLEHKKEISYLFATIIIVAVTFTSLVKYNVIGVIVSLFIFTTIYKKSLLRKSVVLLISVVVAIFVGNYLLGFYLRDVNVASSFYINHFWVYASGSPIYDRYIFDPGINTELSVGHKLMTFLMAFPNMFIKKFFGGDGLFPHIKKSFLPVGTQYGQVSNVTDAFGYLYPAKGDFVEHMLYFGALLILGFIFSRAYMKAKRKSEYFNTYMCNLITYFVFFSFFGTFYINPGPWEMLIYSLIVPSLFLNSTNLRKGIIHLS